jgi:hypothetical protein
MGAPRTPPEEIRARDIDLTAFGIPHQTTGDVGTANATDQSGTLSEERGGRDPTGLSTTTNEPVISGTCSRARRVPDYRGVGVEHSSSQP